MFQTDEACKRHPSEPRACCEACRSERVAFLRKLFASQPNLVDETTDILMPRDLVGEAAAALYFVKYARIVSVWTEDSVKLYEPSLDWQEALLGLPMIPRMK